MPFIKFETFEKNMVCKSKEHFPPNMMILPEGIHTWECPECGHKQKVVVNNPKWKFLANEQSYLSKSQSTI